MAEPHALPGRMTASGARHVSAAEPPYSVLGGDTMGTTWTVKLLDPEGKIPSPDLHASIQAVLEHITQQMSTWDASSTISRLNLAEAGWYQLPQNFFHVLSQALEISRATAGAYDPTVGRLVNLWGFGPAGSITVEPCDNDIAAALATAGWHRTALKPDHHAVWQPGGLHFDLSSIAKGYGVDQVAKVLDQYNVEHYLVEVGGELKARGHNARNTPWALAIEIPEHARPDGMHLNITATAASTLPISLTDCAIATSGDYRRYFEKEGRRYAHTLDPATGAPLAHNLVSVTVLHSECMLADALATALLSMGPQRGPDYARAQNIAALFMLSHPDDLALEWTGDFQRLAQARFYK